ncbi:hypothetical protein EDD86DRAFT_207536 [Gorgonomyces haynaldii]|nr:hypothetical protein EDD86DRAFT_207536 [Gorgonomyces haynaldii]
MLALYIVEILAFSGVLCYRFLSFRNRLSGGAWIKPSDYGSFCMLGHAVFKITQTLLMQAVISVNGNDTLLVFLKAIIGLEIVSWLASGIALVIVIGALVEASGNLTLYDNVTLFGTTIDPTNFYRSLRLGYTLFFFAFGITWGTVGVSSTLETYIFWRRCFFGLIAFMCLFVSAPTLAFFGQRLIATMRARMEGASETMQASAVPTVVPVRFSRDFDKRRLAVFRWQVIACVVLSYIGSALFLLVVIFGFESQLNPSFVLPLRLGSETFMWIVCVYCAPFLAYQEWLVFQKHKK